MGKICKKGQHVYTGSQCKECRRPYMLAYMANYRQTEMGSAVHKAAIKKYFSSPKGKAAIKKYFSSPKGKAALKKRHNNRYNTDPQYRAEKQLRTREANVLRLNSLTGKAVNDLGCNGHQLRAHLESLFKPGMNWLNKGNTSGCWSIDHILPLSRFDLTIREEYLKVAHYTNLQPMWHSENYAKGNKLPDELPDHP